MQRCDVSCAKRARVLFIKEIRDIVMVSETDKEKYYASHCRGTKKSHAHLRDDLPFQSPSPDYSASSSEDDDGLAMWQVNKHNPFNGHYP